MEKGMRSVKVRMYVIFAALSLYPKLNINAYLMEENAYLREQNTWK